MKTSIVIAITILFSFSQINAFAQGKVIPLYPGEIPHSKTTPVNYREVLDTNGLYTQISIPTITVYTPAKGKENGTAVIVLPSGGYRVVVDEGADFAKAFISKGITVFVLKYRLPSDAIMQDKATGPLQDAQMAIKLVRMHAKEYKLDTNKIGFVGVSAGGHIASTAATHLNTVLIDNKEKINLRPDFMVLIYPVISFTRPTISEATTRTVANLLGTNPSDSLLNFFSNEKHVTSNTPPTFLLHAGDDERVYVEHSILFYQALQKAKVKSELHVLQNGGHGFALEHPTRADTWFFWCIDWLHENGFGIKKKN